MNPLERDGEEPPPPPTLRGGLPSRSVRSNGRSTPASGKSCPLPRSIYWRSLRLPHGILVEPADWVELRRVHVLDEATHDGHERTANLDGEPRFLFRRDVRASVGEMRDTPTHLLLDGVEFNRTIRPKRRPLAWIEVVLGEGVAFPRRWRPVAPEEVTEAGAACIGSASTSAFFTSQRVGVTVSKSTAAMPNVICTS